MKQITVVVLSAIYLAFIFPVSANTDGECHPLCLEKSTSGVLLAEYPALQDEEASLFAEDTDKHDCVTQPHLAKLSGKHKNTGHHTGSGKSNGAKPDFITLPIPVCDISQHYLRTGTPEWSSNSIYLHNCVFLI